MIFSNIAFGTISSFKAHDFSLDTWISDNCLNDKSLNAASGIDLIFVAVASRKSTYLTVFKVL